MDQVLYKGESQELLGHTTSVSGDSTTDEYDIINRTNSISWVTASVIKSQCMIITCNCLV